MIAMTLHVYYRDFPPACECMYVCVCVLCAYACVCVRCKLVYYEVARTHFDIPMPYLKSYYVTIIHTYMFAAVSI